MYQQQGHAKPMLSDEDLAYTVLADLKRVASEYTTAVTESSCQQVRQLFTNLLNSTLQLQGQLYKAMEQNNMYSAASPALRQEIQKQLQSNQQTEQKTEQFLQQFGFGQPAFRSPQYQYQQQPMQYQQNGQQQMQGGSQTFM
ncbi:spore coat protein [Paenibacillus sacheonensis]|uniref:Spore coat protein n=1 Tax=Paenibacillus sacheonensis TaxID=742054 RepID=A0A7X4YSA4_9BACL|nr:spore coat protein [Paenibacillus sacheonensis]MBM7566778.1 spore coat protein CotF [Paenibacillus sacheonensis]NBC71647.1 spore coat protein [Paenibacillus sacheonensis]